MEDGIEVHSNAGPSTSERNELHVIPVQIRPFPKAGTYNESNEQHQVSLLL
jgi:hypothetical protein